MKTKPNNIPAKRTLPEPSREATDLFDWPLHVQDPPEELPEITQHEIVAFETASFIFQIARADFEAKRAALTMKLLRDCPCEESDYFVSLDEHNNIVVEDHTSLEPLTNRKIIDREVIPSGGAA
jgi:hypothetical protein